MSNQGGLFDTQKLPKPPENHPHGRAQSPTSSIRRASMMENGSGKNMPNRRPPEPSESTRAKAKKNKPQTARSVSRKKKHGIVFRITVTLIVLILTLFCAYSAVAVAAIQKLRSDEPAERRLEAGAPAEDKKVQNVLLILTDEWGTERGSADSVALVSVSGHNRTVTQTALLSECYVSIPDHGTNRLAAAYAAGGGQLLTDTVVNNFDIPVDHYMIFGIPAFIAVTDALGGIDITLTAKEASTVNQLLNTEMNAKVGDPVDADYLPGGGTYRLSGKQAFCYTQINDGNGTEVERAERRNTVMNRLLDRAQKITPTALFRIIRDVCPQVTTNLSGSSLYLAALKAPYILLRYETQELRLPVDGSYAAQPAQDGTPVLAVDFEQNYEAYRKAVTGSP